MATILGTLDNDPLRGTNFADEIFGFGGNDTLNGGFGADTLVGGAGDDIYRVDNSGDTVIEEEGEGNDTVYTTVDFTLSDMQEIESIRVQGTDDVDVIYEANHSISLIGNVGNNLLSAGHEDDFLRGYDGNDDLAGGDGNDFLLGDGGNDTLRGGLGIDTMVGGDGDDFYIVREFGDSVVEVIGGGTDTVLTRVDFTLGQLQEIEILRAGTSNNVSLTGNDFNNTIIGSNGDDDLNGQAGDDVLRGNVGSDEIDGGLGDDTMSGGTQDDTFIFYDGSGDDRITDYNVVEDMLQFEGLIMSDLEINVTASGANTIIEYGDDSILLIGVGDDEQIDLAGTFLFG